MSIHPKFSEYKSCRVCNNDVKFFPKHLNLKKDSPHICIENENKRLCLTHRSKHSYLFTKERLAFEFDLDKEIMILPNSSEKESEMNVLDLFLPHFSCFLCKNIPRSPMSCDSCKVMVCKYCLANHLNKKSLLCPNCYKMKPNFIQISFKDSSEYIKIFADLHLKVKCKNFENGCQFESAFTHANEHLINHEKECRKCPDCAMLCPTCKNHFKIKEFEKHIEGCKSEPEAQISSRDSIVAALGPNGQDPLNQIG